MDVDEDTVIDTWRQFEESASFVLQKIQRFITEDYFISKYSIAVAKNNEDNGFLQLKDQMKTRVCDLRYNLEKNVEYLEELEQESENIAKNNINVKKNIENLENVVQKLKGKIKLAAEKNADLNKMKNIILAYKLLTSTNIVYSSNFLEGYITGKKKEMFVIDPKKTPPEDIPKIVWELVKSANTSDDST